MLDAARAHAQDAPTLALPPSDNPRPDPAGALVSAARALLPALEAGTALDAQTLRAAMTEAFGATDAAGAWTWKDAYEAAEAAIVMFMRRYGRAMRNAAGPGPDGPAAMLAMIGKIAALEPSQTRRSEDQLRMQQFSTPLPLAYAALQAARIRPGDRVLEPSAGTGMLAVMASLALGGDENLHLNELAPARAGILAHLFPGSTVTRRNAESAADRLAEVRPTVVLMNPPFSVSPGVSGIRHHADLAHIRSAASMLPEGGRLVTISSEYCPPGGRAWNDAFASLDPPARCVFTAAIDGRAYARRGTGFDTRLTVLDRTAETGHRALDDVPQRVDDAAQLLASVTAAVPERLPIQRPRGTDLFGHAPAPAPTPRAKSAARTACVASPAARDWGPVAELDCRPAARDAAPSAGGCGPWEPWAPRVFEIPGAAPHPTPLVQSAAMAAVPHPLPSYRPMLPVSTIADARLSDAQLESVVLAGEAHDGHLAGAYRIGSGWETVQRHDPADPRAAAPDPAPDGEAETLGSPVAFRRGWMLGDGTGCGKGRQVAAIILDRWLRGTRRALWLSQSDKLLEDARRDWQAVGGEPSDVIPLGKFRQGAEIAPRQGILFATYATLRSPARQDRRARLDQVVEWLAGSLEEDDRHAFDGVVVFDEAHAMANAAGSKGERGEVRPSQQGRAGLRLQNALPDARVLYVSATGATTLQGLAYARRLGLWGSDDTPFAERGDFVTAMEAGGVAAMEIVARDLKALGLYQARALSYAGVEIDILEHALTPEQRRIYDAYADAFKIIHRNLEEALKATGIVSGAETLNRNAKSAARSAFEGAKQRFFGHLLTSMKCPSLIRAIERDLERDRAAVVQLVSTGEALMERRLSEIPASEWEDLSIDLTPREYVLDFLQHAFPVQLYEPFTDDEGNLMSRAARDADGNPVICREAVERRDDMIQRLAALPAVPTALDQILQRFGDEAVAEVTGRSRRILRIREGGGDRLALRNRPPSANLAETAAFMDGTKLILVFSMAGGTGRSYHADLSAGNTQRRIHYLLEPGWRADQAIQGLGRTHRTHQASAPLFRPVATDVKGERRFIATIARRLDSLGAITRGQRDSQTAMGEGDAALFRASDNLESVYARAALRQFYLALWRGAIPGWSLSDFEEATGLRLVNEGGLKEELPPMPQFLNRLLALPIAEQNQLFAALEARIDSNIADAIEAGTFERGVETIAAESLTVQGRETVFIHRATGAETEIVEIARRDRLVPLPADEAIALHAAASSEPPDIAVNARSGRAALILAAPSRMLENGGVQDRVRLLRPNARETIARAELEASHWTAAPEPQWRAAWDSEIASLPSHTESRFWIVTGLLLPVWDRLPDVNMRVRRLVTDPGTRSGAGPGTEPGTGSERLIGRVLGTAELRGFRAAFGLASGPSLSADELHDEIMGRGKTFHLANGWRLARRRHMGAERIEIHGPDDRDIEPLKAIGCFTEIVSWRARVFVPGTEVLARLLERRPLADSAEAA